MHSECWPFGDLQPAFGKIFELNRSDRKTSCSVVRRLGQRVIVHDVETCEFIVGTPALEDHRKTGIRAVQSTPLISRSGHLLGIISTHWREPHQPAERDLRLLDVLARQAADLLERLRSERTLAESEERFRSLFTSAPMAVFVLRPERGDSTLQPPRSGTLGPRAALRGRATLWLVEVVASEWHAAAARAESDGGSPAHRRPCPTRRSIHRAARRFTPARSGKLRGAEKRTGRNLPALSLHSWTSPSARKRRPHCAKARSVSVR